MSRAPHWKSAIGAAAACAILALIALWAHLDKLALGSSASPTINSAHDGQSHFAGPTPSIHYSDDLKPSSLASTSQLGVQRPSEAQLLQVVPKVPEGSSLPSGWTPPAQEFGTVYVHVAAMPGGLPAPGVFVSLCADEPYGFREVAAGRSTDAFGSARFDRVPSGIVRAIAHPIGTNSRGEVTSGLDLYLNLQIHNYCTIRGVVRGFDGSPVADAEIWEAGPTPSDTPVAYTARDGHFELRMRSRHANFLCAKLAGFLPSRVIRLEPCAPGATEQCDLDLGRAGSALRVEIVGSDSERVPGAVVSLCLTHEGSPDLRHWGECEGCIIVKALWRQTTDATGRVFFNGLPSGNLALQVGADGYVLYRSLVQLPPTGSVEVVGESSDSNLLNVSSLVTVAPTRILNAADGTVQVTLDRGEYVEGRLWLPGARPAADAMVGYSAFGSAFPRVTTTDQDGFFRIGPVPSESIRLHASCLEFRLTEQLPSAPRGAARWWEPTLRLGQR